MIAGIKTGQVNLNGDIGKLSAELKGDTAARALKQQRKLT